MSNNPDDVTGRLKRSLDGSGPELSDELVTGASARTAPKLSNPHRGRQIAGGLGGAVAAVAIGSLVVTMPFQQDPLFVAGGQAGAYSEAATMDMRIAQWVNYEYIAGEGLSTEGGSGNVYQLRRTGTAEETLNRVAENFGIDGTPVKADYYDPAYPTWVLGAQDGSAPSMYITWTGTGSWSYNDPTAYPAVVCEDTIVEGIDEPQSVCAQPEIPASESLAPSEADAKTQAQALFESTGLDVEASDIRVIADAWSTTATANLVVAGTATAIDWGVSWSPTGKISFAYGHSIEVDDRGSFGTVSATDSVARLADGRWFGSAGPDYQGGMTTFARSEMGMVDDTVPAPTDIPAEQPTMAPDDGTGIEPDPQPTVLPELPMPIDPTEIPIDPTEIPLPEPETVTVTIDKAEATLLLMWDTDGNAWLVPGYAMQQPEGWWNTVVSLVEGVIELPAPFEE